MPECVHAIEQRDCGACRDRAHARPPLDPALFGPWSESAIVTYCTGCGQRIEPGDDMRSSNSRGWLCLPCGAPQRSWRGPEGYDRALLAVAAAGMLDTGRGTG